MTHKILLADDSVTIRKVVELTFSDEDFTIVSVGDGAQALERARAERPDIIISDVIMPGMNGYELCQQVKGDPGLRSIPFLFLKGTFESFDDQRAQACGADGFIVKPFESQEMISRVKALIATGRATAAAPVPPPPSAVPVAPAWPVAPPPAPPAIAIVSPPAPVMPVAPPRPAPTPVPAMPVAPSPPPAAVPPPLPPPMPPASPLRMAPPMPPRPVRPLEIPSAPAPAPASQVVPPAAVTPQPASAQPVAPRVPASTSFEEFGFDFGLGEGTRTSPTAAPVPVHEPAAAVEPPGETDEDLWSEVSLRDRSSDVLQAPESSAAESWPAGATMELEEPAAAADETVLDEIPAPPVILEPEAGPAVTEEVEEPLVAPAAELPEETPAAPEPQPAAPASLAVDQGELERLVAARLETAVRQALEPVVRELARTVIESVAWEVIPDLAEAMIRTEIERIRQSARTD